MSLPWRRGFQERAAPAAGRRYSIGIVDLARDGVVIEVVGRQWHLDRFAPDDRRYARLTAAGERLLTFTFDDVEGRPGHVVDATRAALDAVLSRTDGRTGNSSAAP